MNILGSTSWLNLHIVIPAWLQGLSNQDGHYKRDVDFDNKYEGASGKVIVTENLQNSLNSKCNVCGCFEYQITI